MRRKIWLASTNVHKKYEFEQLLGPLGFDIHTPDELDNYADVAETGTSFSQNARLKAEALYVRTKQAVVADDSGLSVPVLAGAPGIFSARYAGDGASDQQNRRRLLKQMEGLEQREARFTCALVFIDDMGANNTYIGHCDGNILLREMGVNGFGYDSIFFSTVLNKTLAEANDDEKNRVSHRGKAVSLLLEHSFFAPKLKRR
ncbi:MAG: RdgB/HAM1 family non-canonical purine NTP pyrophosphatase [Culicoidibacterales bacterium]